MPFFNIALMGTLSSHFILITVIVLRATIGCLLIRHTIPYLRAIYSSLPDKRFKLKRVAMFFFFQPHVKCNRTYTLGFLIDSSSASDYMELLRAKSNT